ncbi:hypothetical protein OQJ65_03700 [Vibrio sp. Sgm 22]|uniref:hypothetical protein n=1 Tax=unclassified Vibrio TaxID=2614977 RepID=UPI0022497B54|nr:MULTISPECIES: hypothetical protein [unclassified Vibrio]MCX2758959.1 hypothetical protein [Vibrio sp. 14G-20]MCX2774419.1 hypothetical protein [Vibrio sp. Sgm 22]
MKIFYYLIMGCLLLTGCGGGSGGGSDGSTGSDGGSFSGLPDPGGTLSEDYDVSQLRAQATFSNNTVTDTSIVVTLSYEKDATRLMSLTGLDEIEVLVDGTLVALTNIYGSLYSYDMPTYAATYEVIWKRDGEVVAATSFDGQPSAIPLTSTYDGSGYNYAWTEDSEVVYRFVIPSLSCLNSEGVYETFHHWENDDLSKNVVTGGAYYVPLSLFNNFTEEELRSNYQTCDISIDITGEHKEININDSNSLIKGIAMGAGVSLETIF